MVDWDSATLAELIGAVDISDEPEPVWNRPSTIIGMTIVFAVGRPPALPRAQSTDPAAATLSRAELTCCHRLYPGRVSVYVCIPGLWF